MALSYKDVAIKAALKSGALIRNSVGKVTNISYKGRDNIVTDVDKKSEGLIINTILSSFPDHAILSEESMPRKCDSQYRWIIDPLDGTTNFAHGFPFFSVSIALERAGSIIMGVVYDPMREEMFYAESHKGSHLNNKKIRVSGTTALAGSLLATGFSYGNKEKMRNVKHFSNFLLTSLAVRRAGSAALDLCYVACGRFDGYWELNLHPWDCAAGILIVSEAGGIITRFDGSQFTPFKKDILATNNLIHPDMINVLTKT